ncbi:MAG TPA: hypothetical protein VFH66_12995 [Mycobacteriales bacterium]|nr:hypothetical protein [Mycobacteriales bacterium]
MSDVVRTDDEPALRAALADLTVGQPDLPVDRVAGVRRRHARRRQLQAAAAAGAMAIAALGVIAVSGVFHGARSTQSLNRPVPSWALPWDDHRDGSVPQPILAGAVSHWVADQLAKAPLPPNQPITMRPVVWYLGTRIPGTDHVVAVFEATGLHAGALALTKGPRLVVAHAAWSDVTHSSVRGGYAWSYVDVAAPSPGYAGVIGGYAPAGNADGGFDNVAWLLTSPKARDASWTVETAGGRTLSGDVPLDHGYASVDVGQVMSRVRINALATGPEGQSVPFHGWLGVPGAPGREVPTLVSAGSLVGVPQGRLTLGESSSQGSSVYVDGDANAPAGRPTTVYARCYSADDARSIRVTVDGDITRIGRSGVRVVCDGQQHVLPGNPTGDPTARTGAVGHSVGVRASNLTAWTVAVVIHA